MEHLGLLPGCVRSVYMFKGSSDPGIMPPVVGSLPEPCSLLFLGLLLPAVFRVSSVGTKPPPAPQDPLQRGSHLPRTLGLR